MGKCHSLRAYAGGVAIVLGSFGIVISAVLLPLSLFGHSFWTGFSPDGPGRPAAERQAAVSRAIREDLLGRFVPLIFGSVTSLGYGLYEARKEEPTSDGG